MQSLERASRVSDPSRENLEVCMARRSSEQPYGDNKNKERKPSLGQVKAPIGEIRMISRGLMVEGSSKS